MITSTKKMCTTTQGKQNPKRIQLVSSSPSIKSSQIIISPSSQGRLRVAQPPSNPLTQVLFPPSTLTYTWTIDNFDSLEAKGENVITSPITTESKNYAWYLEMKPNGENAEKDTISLYLYLHSSSLAHEVFANFNADILNAEGKKMSSKSIQAKQFIAKTTLQLGRSWGWHDFLTKDDYFRKNILSDNKLTIYIELEVSMQRNFVLNRCYQKSLRPNVHKCNLSENFASLLESQAFSDVVLSTNGKEFPAHKLILAARSTVFTTMFQNTAKKRNPSIIEIKDLSAEVVEEMLRFIYTGKCEKLDELAEGLLAASDKYDLDRLKIICSKALCKALAVGNAANILILADLHRAEELKSDAIEFIVSRSSEVFGTAGWKNLLSKGQLIDEVFQSMARRLASLQAK